MVFLLRLVLSLLLAAPWAAAQERARFRIWMAGREAGGRETLPTRSGGREGLEAREWIRIERLGMVVEQRVEQAAFRDAQGRLEFTWSVRLSREPLEGRATWDPADPRRMRVFLKDLPERVVELEEGLVLWPEEQEARMKEAARARRSLSLRGFAPATQQATELELQVLGPDPLPGFPDAVRFKGLSREGAMQSETEFWISPSAGQLKESASIGGIPILVQRAELPAPPGAGPAAGFFERTLKALPPHPFLPWIPGADLRWEGPGEPQLPEDGQQARLGPGRMRLCRAAQPDRREAAEPPVQGPPAPGDAPFLAPSPLVPFRDPVFDGLLVRLRAPAGASRWELARRVNRFVFEWITEKDYTVGFASAAEVARTPRGDCTEHGVLAVALLRRLGVPSRGVLGWIGAGGVLGLHFWVEVELGGRWVPIDPTFDEAPASALHLKLGTTDLADLGSVGWDTAATRFAEGSWAPEGDWARGVQVRGDRVLSPEGTGLRLAGAAWRLAGGELSLLWRGVHPVEAVPRPPAAQLGAAKAFQSPRTGRRGWWQRAPRMLWVQLDEARWVRAGELDERQAVELLEGLELLPPA